MIKVVQVGFGIAGQRRVRVLSRKAGVLLVGVADPDEEAQKRARAQLEPGVAVHATCDDLLAEVEADAVIVSAPHHLHADLTGRALAHGMHVLCEKPFGVNEAQARACVQLARERGRLLKVGTNHLYFPSVERALAVLHKRDLGMLRHIRVAVGHGHFERLPAWFRDPERVGGGALRDNGVHGLLLVQQVLRRSGDHIAIVSCQLDRLPDAAGVDVRARCDMVSERGVSLRLESRWVGQPAYQLDADIVGEWGSVHISGPECCTLRCGNAEQRYDFESPDDVSWSRDTEAFVEAIRAGAREHVSAVVASDSGRVLDALYASAEAQRPVQLTR